jgi:hypothetical protein
MAQSRKVQLTPKILESLEELKKVVADLPPGEARMRAEAALAHHDQSFRGQAQLKVSRRCPVNTNIIRS